MLERIQGLSLIELLLSLLFGSILLMMLFELYVTSTSNSLNNLKFSRLRTDLQSLMWIMESDIRRAGYGGEKYQVGDFKNKSIDINQAKNCIVFYYNHDNSTTLQSSNKMGFLFDPQKYQVFVASGALPLARDCRQNRWRALLDVHFIKITALMFTVSMVTTSQKTSRYVHIKLQGELSADASYTYALSTVVRLRNTFSESMHE